MVDHGGVRRPDPQHREVRHRRASSRERHPAARPWLPGVRDAARAHRQGAADRGAARGHLLLVRRHAARARQRRGPVFGQGQGRRRAHRLLAARCPEDRARPSPAPGRVFRGGLRDHGAGQRDGRVPGPRAEDPELLGPGLARAGAARHRGHPERARQSHPGLPGRRTRLRGDGIRGIPSTGEEISRSHRGDRLRAGRHPARHLDVRGATRTRPRRGRESVCAFGKARRQSPGAGPDGESLSRGSAQVARRGRDPGQRLRFARGVRRLRCRDTLRRRRLSRRRGLRVHQRASLARGEEAPRMSGLRHALHARAPARRHHGQQRRRMRRLLSVSAPRTNFSRRWASGASHGRQVGRALRRELPRSPSPIKTSSPSPTVAAAA